MGDQDAVTPGVMESPPGPETRINGRNYLYFGGTSYLGLHAHRDVIRAAARALRQYGVHPATSRARVGNAPPVLSVERECAGFFGAEEAFYFVSGYVGMHILVQSAAEKVDALFCDEALHHSGREAACLARKPVYSFRSQDPEDLRRTLKRCADRGRFRRPMVLTDGINPGVGWIAPLREYAGLLQSYPGAVLLVDDAHGVGTLGEHGRGTLEHFGLWGPAVNAGERKALSLLCCGTLSKAVGGFGGVVAGTRSFVQRTRTCARYFEAASAPSCADAAASCEGLRMVRRRPELRRRMQARVRQARSGLRGLGLPVVEDSPVPIIGLDLGSAARMQRLSRELLRRGIYLPYLPSYPGVGPRGALRLAIFANHRPGQIQHLIDTLKMLL